MTGQGSRFVRSPRLLGALALALAAAALWSATASAAVSCRVEGETLFVELSAGADRATVGQSAGTIIVSAPANVPCAGGTPTLAGIENVNVLDGSPGGEAKIIETDKFAANGVKFIVAMTGGAERLVVFGFHNAPEHVVAGLKGIDTDGDGDLDISFFGAVPSVEIQGSFTADTISAHGSVATGGSLTAGTAIRGFGGDDNITGGEGPDDLEGGEGDDQIQGLGGDDRIFPDDQIAGDDLVEGGPGTDTVLFEQSEGPIRVDLEDTKPQQTGEGEDQILGFETVVGSATAANTLLGNEGPNRLVGGGAVDFFDGREGDDTIEGKAAENEVSYAGSPGPVTVSLAEGKASGADGADQLSGIFDVVGSRFADTLIGNDGRNTIEPLGGTDLVQALGGEDTIRARDGAKDDVSCGAGVDSAVVDGGLDTVRSDCERVDPQSAAPGGGSSGGAGGGGGTGGGGGKTVRVKVTGAAKQRLVAKHALFVTVRCPQEACSVAATASGRLAAVGSEPKATLKLGKVTKKLAAGKAKRLALPVGRKQAAAIAARLRAGKRVALTVTVKATDAAGAHGTALLHVTAKP